VINLQEFHLDFLQSIYSDADSRGLLRPRAFFENVCEELVQTGDLTANYTEAEYKKIGMEVHGYDYDKDRRILFLLINQFFQDEELRTLTKKDIEIKFKRLKTFYLKGVDGYYQNMEEAYESYSMAYSIFRMSENNEIDKVKLILITDGKATRNLEVLPPEMFGDIEIEYRVIDIEYLYKIYLSETNCSEFSVDVDIPYLHINTSSDDYKSYLSYITGEALVDIYEQFGQKLFEQNVRTFLQFRGNVNKGLRNTIEYKPEMFFAYNNGLTATATGLKTSNGRITNISNFQIVNGGQTTSAIYAASKQSKMDVSSVSVQMKLSVLENNDKKNDFVSKISEYANTQNKINKSDFFSNSPYHKEFKKYSKQIWVSARGGVQQRTHWFYERVRGEYLNEQAYLTKPGRKKFQIENPKNQKLDKTFLAKSENSWLQKPHIVSKGAQFNFSNFADSITAEIEKNSLIITEAYFKDSICRTILFREVEKMVSQATWYDGGYRAQTVTYTIAFLARAIERRGKYLNFDVIWEQQKLPNSLIQILKQISESIYENICNPPEGHANVSQWCKKELCWKHVKSLQIAFTLDNKLLNDKEEEKYNKREAKKEKTLVKGIEMQIFVAETPHNKWNNLHKYFERENYDGLSTTEEGVLKSMAEKKIKVPTERQSKVLYKLYVKANDEGFVW
jgi:hypothetical protein